MQTIINTKEAANILGVATVSTIARRVQSGRLEPVGKLPGLTGAYLFDKATIETIRDSRRAA